MRTEEFIACEVGKLPSERKIENLMELHKHYDDNFLSMNAALEDRDMAAYGRFLGLERKMEKLCSTMQKDLGIYIPNPCPLQNAKFCTECTGWYEPNMGPKSYGHPKHREVMVGVGTYCNLKEV